MSKLFVQVLLIVTATAAHGSELPACPLGSALLASVLERSRASPDSATSLVVTGELRNGAAIAYAKDDPVLVVGLQVVRALPALVPSGDVLLRNSWPLSPNFRFASGQTLYTPSEVEESGRIYRVLTLSDRSVLLIDPEGRFCNKAANARTPPAVWMAGTLSQQPDDVQLVPKVIEELGEKEACVSSSTAWAAGR
jgi:hypothetical protein